MAYCPECGKKVAEHATFCASCGKKIKAEETKPDVKETKEEPKREEVKDEQPVTNTAPKSGSGGKVAMGCGIAALLIAILIFGLCVLGFFALTFVGAKGQPGTIMKNTEVKAPMDLKVTDADKEINLSWKKSSASDIAKYNVYKSTKNGADYKKVSSLEADATSYKDTDAKKGNTYYYVVTAQNSGGTESGNSNQAIAALTPAPIIPKEVTSWKDVLDKYNADNKYAELVGTVTGLNKSDIENFVAQEAKGKKLKTVLKKGTLITNTTEGYKIIPQYYLPTDKEFLTDNNGNPHIMMWCGNPIKLLKKPSPVTEAIQKVTVNIVNIMPVYVTNIIVNASIPLNTFVVGILPNSFGTTVMNPEATDTADEWPEDQVLTDSITDLGPGIKDDLEEGQQWASHGKILLEANPADPGPGEGVTMIIHIFPAESNIEVTYSVSGTDGYTASGTLTTNEEGKTEFYIPGGAEGIADTISVTVPSRGDEGSTSYTF